MRSKQQPRPSFRWPQQRGDNVSGEDGIESSGPGTDLQLEDGDCVDEDGPISPGCQPKEAALNTAAARENQIHRADHQASEEEDEDDDESRSNVRSPPTNPSPSQITTRLNHPASLRDTTGPQTTDRELMSPRCPSRDSRDSPLPVAGSPAPHLSANRSSQSPIHSPTGIVPLPLGVHPLLPPQSAAMMAAYLQTHQRMLLGHSPLSRSSISPLVSSSCSPPAATPGLHVSPTGGGVSPSATPLPAVLDFSTRKNSSAEEEEDEHILNLSKPPTPSSSSETNNGPLDLSVSSSRKRPGPDDSPPLPNRKSTRMSSASGAAATAQDTSPFSRQVVSPWTSPVVASHFPYFAAAVAAAATSQQQQQQLSSSSSSSSKNSSVDHHHPHHQLWNGKMKPPANLDKTYQPSEATKALEKMSELSKLGGEDLFRAAAAGSASAGSGSSRHSAWQSHWLNKGADQAKDVLKCVWCKQSFPTLAAMTTHMKEAKHCGVNMPVPPSVGGQSRGDLPNVPSSPQHHHQPPGSSSASDRQDGRNSSGSGVNKQSPSELNLLIKETMPLPRKLVRGQDVWLGKGAEQTRQILKCMWCGQSFRSLAEMTSHMQQTQHYTNIISQEQIISWKSSDENKGGGGGGGGGGGSGGGSGAGGGGGSGGNSGGSGNSGSAPGGGSNQHGPSGGGPGSTSSHVTAVLTCKVCDQAFSSLKELSNHMVKNSHYKEHIMRSITESGGRRRQTREKRKKSLPVRKLLELERAQNEFKNGDIGATALAQLGKHAGRITCEKCGEKIETAIFVDHIRQCVGAGALGASQRNFLKNALMSNHLSNPQLESGRKSVNEDSSSVSSRHHRSPSSASDATTPGKETPTNESSGGQAAGGTSSSVLNAIEKLIEKSFDSRMRHGASGMHHAQPGGTPIGSSILKRLGIDESVDYTKPLVDPQTMNLLRSYQQQQFNAAAAAAAAARRERSGSESSSISERGSARTDTLTPERKLDLSTSSSPDKQVVPLPSTAQRHQHQQGTESEGESDAISLKKEPKDESETGAMDDDEEERKSLIDASPRPIKKEIKEEQMRDEDRQSPEPVTEDNRPKESAGIRSPCRNSTSSPASSDRSITPRGTPDTKASSCLGALSSMFDSLSGGGSGSANANSENQGGRKSSSHPLAALQKLCDKTETRGGNSNRSSSASSSGGGGGGGGANSASTTPAGTTPGAILAFSWACNDAVMTADSIMKCAFCDTPFISKGAYRHHLSKMHFVKDGVIPDPLQTLSRSAAAAAAAAASSGSAQSPGGASVGSGPSRGSTSPPSTRASVAKSPPALSQANGSPSQPAAATSPLEESPHSKFLKYTELAKQLSSKYV